jgi:hypothetical protein
METPIPPPPPPGDTCKWCGRNTVQGAKFYNGSKVKCKDCKKKQVKENNLEKLRTLKENKIEILDPGRNIRTCFFELLEEPILRSGRISILGLLDEIEQDYSDLLLDIESKHDILKAENENFKNKMDITNRKYDALEHKCSHMELDIKELRGEVNELKMENMELKIYIKEILKGFGKNKSSSGE